MPDFARAHYNLGQLLNFMQQSQRAQTALEHVFQLEPDNPEYLNALVQHYLRNRKFPRRLAESLSAKDSASPLAEAILGHIEKEGINGK